jgi:hypothetical protein
MKEKANKVKKSGIRLPNLFLLNADPDQAFHQSDATLLMVYRPSTVASRAPFLASTHIL